MPDTSNSIRTLLTDEQATELNEPIVQQLAQTCFDPLLYDSCRVGEGVTSFSEQASSNFLLTESRWEMLKRLDANPAPLQEFMAAKPGTGRLGIYFEHLFEFFLRNDPAIKLLSRNLAVRHEGHTLGEFDFIYHEIEADTVTHHELAVKYYMGFDSAIDKPITRTFNEDKGQDTNDITMRGIWLGPAVHDSFEQKLAKLETKQSRLTQSAEAKHALAQAGIPEPQLFRNTVNGQLFYPTRPDKLGKPPAPTHCNTNHLKGQWLTVADLEQADIFESWNASNYDRVSTSTLRFLPRGKLQWLSPLVEGAQHKAAIAGYNEEGKLASASNDLMNREAFIVFAEKQFEKYKRPFMAELFSERALGRRIFVAPNEWPYL